MKSGLIGVPEEDIARRARRSFRVADIQAVPRGVSAARGQFRDGAHVGHEPDHECWLVDSAIRRQPSGVESDVPVGHTASGESVHASVAPWLLVATAVLLVASWIRTGSRYGGMEVAPLPRAPGGCSPASLSADSMLYV